MDLNCTWIPDPPAWPYIMVRLTMDLKCVVYPDPHPAWITVGLGTDLSTGKLLGIKKPQPVHKDKNTYPPEEGTVVKHKP